MSVFVGIQMSGPDACIHNLPDLARELIVDLDSPQRCHQTRYRCRIPLAPHQDQMDADVQLRIFARQRDGVVERRAGRHQCGRGENSLPMRVHNALVDIARKAEVIGVRDEVFQKRPSLMRRNFFGLARKSCMSPCISRVAPLRLSYNCGLTSSCPMVPCPELTLSMMRSNLAIVSTSCLCSSSLFSSFPAVPCPAFKSWMILSASAIVLWSSS